MIKKSTAILLAMLCLAGCTSVPKNQTAPVPLKLYVFECGQNDVRDISMFAPGVPAGIPKKMIVSCYLLMHPLGNLLWDSGLSDELAQKPQGITKMDGKFHLTVERPFLTALSELGITPKDITHLAFSHFHSDHTGNANAFFGAKLFIQEEEYAAAFGPQPEKFGFAKETYEALKNGPMQIIHGDHDVFGDGSVIIKRAIGHTPGHQTLFIRLPKTGPVLLSGDLYHFTDNRIFKRVPSFNFSKKETLKSMDIIEDFVRTTKAIMWIQHDYEQITNLRQAPRYYE